MIKSIKSKGLRQFAATGNIAKLSVQNPGRIARTLSALDATARPKDMDLPGLRFRGLHTDPKRYAVDASGNWQIIFAWDEGAIDVDLEDYIEMENVMNDPLLADIAPAHPGALLREGILPAISESKAGIARLLGVSRQTLYDILSERQPVTPAMALRLGKLLGNRPEMWLNMQHAYDLHAAARKLAGQLDAIPTLKAA